MFLATDMSLRDESRWGENIMSKRLLIALLGAGFTCATLSAQELPLIHQPTLTPQDSGTTNGLIAVWPVNPKLSGHPVATAHLPSPLMAERLGTRASYRAPKPCNFVTC